MQTQIVTIHSSDEYLGRAVREAIEMANSFLSAHSTAQVIHVQTMHEIDTGGDYPQSWYTHLITISYRKEG
jgi:hypothetical protein